MFGLDPDVTLGEILFGLVMVLTFTLGAGIAAGPDPDEARALIIAAMGCNIAWGLIDAVFYLMGLVFVRSRRSLLIEGLRSETDQAAAIAAVRDELEGQVTPIVHAEDRAALYERIYSALTKVPPAAPTLDRGDIRGAIGVFLIVSLTVVPAAIPFAFIDEPWIALRVSNAILIGLLFLVGYRWAGYTLVSPLRAGLVLMAIGVVLVAVAIALGG